MKYLCRDLSFSIELDSDMLQFSIGDGLVETTICYPVNYQPSDESKDQRRYRLREAMLFGLRHLIGQAMAKGLISDNPGEWTPLSKSVGPDPSTSSTIDIASW